MRCVLARVRCLYLESLNNKVRRRNLVITVMSEDADETSATDKEKILKVLEAAKYYDAVDLAKCEVRRLDQPNERKNRPIICHARGSEEERQHTGWQRI